jgi:Zn-dependent M28 family amino/carboxypeptidase
LRNQVNHCTFLFVGFAGEEKGLIGSRYYAQQSNFQKTIATANNRPVNDADDAFLGYDQADSNPSNVGISLGAPKSISSYIGNVGDGKNWLERLTANLKYLRVPLTTDSLITSTVPPGTPPLSVASATPVANLTLSNHPRLQACGTTASCAASAVTGGQIVFGSVTLAHGEATVKGFSPSFKTADSFQCTASDRTIAVNAGNAVAVSGSSIVVRGTGNDVIAYMCAGT